MSWLDKVVTLAVQSAGSLIGTRPTVNFSGSGVTVTDDSANNRVNVAIAGASVSDATTTTKGIVQLAGDIAGTATSVQVAKVNGVSVSGTPSNGQILTASGSSAASWAAPAAPSDATTLAKGIVQLAGDIAGTATSVTVAKVNGISVSGTPSASQVLTASSGTAASWAALPAASTSAEGIVQLAGDLAGTNTSVTVAKVNGVSVSGTPSSGQVLTASGSTAASWQTPSGGVGAVPTGGLYNWDLSGPSSGWTNTGTGASVVPIIGANSSEESAGLWLSRKTAVRGYGVANDHIVGRNSSMPGGFSVDLKSSSLTLEAYFSINSTLGGTPYYPIVLNDFGVGSNSIYVAPSTNANLIVITQSNNATYCSTNTNFPFWYGSVHVAVVLDRSDPSSVTLSTYYDGVLVQFTSLGSYPAFSTNFSQFQIGYSYCTGMAGWMCLRNTALTAAQVRANTLILRAA